MKVFAVSRRASLVLALAAAVALLAAALAVGVRRRAPAEPEMSAPETVPAAKIDPWKEAAVKIEEDRGEAAGRAAKIEIPEQLKHYSDRRRFLASQVAAWREHRFETPHDFPELVSMIKRGELVEVPALGENHILYGVGFSAPDEPFTHYDKATGKSVTLYGSEEELAQEYAQIEEAVKELAEAIKALEEQLKEAPKRDRALRKDLTEEIAEKRRATTALKDRRKLLESFYKNEERRAVLAAEYEEIASLARDFGGSSYDLADAESRKELKVRLLSHVRPAALQVIEEVAASYREKFGRHLPVTSLVRTDEYQRQLSTTNPNATLIEVAPHTVGLAFDVFYRFMTASEQQHVMADLARLRDGGRVEALRERRDHYHVFAFAGGRPPDERLIREQLGEKAKAGGEKEQEKDAGKDADKKQARAAAPKKAARAPKGAPQKKKSAPQKKSAPPKKRAARSRR